MRFMAAKTNAMIHLGLIFVAVCVCMNSSLNPLSGSVPGTDSSVFMTIAQGMLHGKAPYLDFFDHKGPLVYFINAAGLALGGFTGLWFLELFFMGVSVIFAYKTARFFGGGFNALLGVVSSFIILTSFFEGGNLTEEYVLPFIFVSLYIFLKYYFTGIEPGKIQIGVTGACFGCSLLLRPNMFAVWASFCMVIFVQKIARKEYLRLFRYALFFLLGLAAALLPIFAYLKITHSLDECIRQYIHFNITYASSPARAPATFFTFAKSVYFVVNKSIAPLIVCFILLLRKPAAMQYGFVIAYALSLLLSISLISMSRMNYLHYNMVLIPLFVPAFTICISLLLRLFSSAKYPCVKYGGLLFVLCIFLNLQMVGMARSIYSVIHANTKSRFRQIGEFINANTRDEDTITVFGNSCYFYLYSGRESASKYIYQIPPAVIVPEILDEYLSDLQRKKPALIIVGNFDLASRGRFPSVYSMVDNEYTECFRTDEKTPFIIFKRK